jgi:hypothetical protein
MALHKRNVDQLAPSFFDKEATYDAGPGGWTGTSACSLKGFSKASLVTTPDQVVNDREGVSGSEHPTEQEIIRKDWRLDFEDVRVKPNTLAGFAAMALGVISSTKDGTYDAWRHKITPVAPTVELPSVGMLYEEAGTQYQAKGVKANGLTLKVGEDGFFTITVPLIGSGTRATDATSFPAAIDEKWLRTGKIAGLWLETGADISINASPTQGAQAISSGVPDDLTDRLLGLTFTWNPNLLEGLGFIAGGGDVRSRLPKGDAAGEISFTVEADSTTWATEVGYYENQDACAVHLAVDMGTVIATGGTYKYGFDLIIPLFKLQPLVRGERDGFHTIEFKGEVMDDGTNDEVILYVYNAQSTYLA